MWTLKKNKTSEIPILQIHSAVLQGQEKAASLVHTDQHRLGNSDLKTSSPLEQSHMAWKTAPHPLPPLCWTSVVGSFLLLEVGGVLPGWIQLQFWGGHVACALGLASRNGLRPPAGNPMQKVSLPPGSPTASSALHCHTHHPPDCSKALDCGRPAAAKILWVTVSPR